MQEFLMTNQWFAENQWIFLPFIAWTLFWKGWALWVASRRGQKVWFVALLVLNTLGLLEIAYLVITLKLKTKAKPAAPAPLQ
jgi:hypothetical protein